MSGQTNELTGTWKSDRTDGGGISSYGDVTLTFGADGELLYTIHEPGRDQVIRMTFHVEPGFIVTDQPSEQREERTAYEIRPDGKLTLTFGGVQSLYVRTEY